MSKKFLRVVSVPTSPCQSQPTTDDHTPLAGNALKMRSLKLIQHSLGSLLQIRSFFRNDRSFYGTDLKADAAINTGSKVNPVPVSTLDIFTRSFMDASHWTSINAIGNAFTSIGNNCVWHSVLSLDSWLLVAD
jgi:hypothetical protein